MNATVSDSPTKKPLPIWIIRFIGIVFFITSAFITGGIGWLIKTDQLDKTIAKTKINFYEFSAGKGYVVHN